MSGILVSPSLSQYHAAMNTSSPLLPGAHAFTTTSGATLTYYVTGAGPSLLVNVSPGWGCASALYQNSFGFLEPNFTIVHFEPRGTRGSSFPDDLSAMSSWDMSEDVESLRVHLEKDTIGSLLGHSNGGCIATWYASRYPDRVDKLVLVDSQLLGSGSVSAPATQAILDARPDRESVDAWENWKKTAGTVETDDEFAAGLSSFFALYVARPEKSLAAVKAAFTNKPQIACRKAQGAAEGRHPDQKPELGKITASTLVIVGREDFICPVPVSELISAGIKNSRLQIIDNTGHFPWIEEKNMFSQVIGEWFA